MHSLFWSFCSLWIALLTLTTLLTVNIVPLAEAISANFYSDVYLGGSQFTVTEPRYNLCYFNDQMNGVSSFSFHGDLPTVINYSTTIYFNDDCSGIGFTYTAIMTAEQNSTVNVLDFGFNDNVNAVMFGVLDVPNPGFSYNSVAPNDTMPRLSGVSKMVYVSPQTN